MRTRNYTMLNAWILGEKENQSHKKANRLILEFESMKVFRMEQAENDFLFCVCKKDKKPNRTGGVFRRTGSER